MACLTVRQCTKEIPKLADLQFVPVGSESYPNHDLIIKIMKLVHLRSRVSQHPNNQHEGPSSNQPFITAKLRPWVQTFIFHS